MRYQMLDGQLFRCFSCVLEYVRGVPGRLGAKSWQPKGRAASECSCQARLPTALEAEGKATLRASAWLRSSAGAINTDIHIAL